MATHIGKIARLPKPIREQLNQRLENGEKGKTLVHWLNTLPEVQKIITDQFGGHPIREQNLSDWKCGGYIDWLNHQQLREQVFWNNETSTDLNRCGDSVDIADNLGVFMSAELILQARALQKIKDPEKRWHRFRQVSRELSRLRRDGHRYRRNELHTEKFLYTIGPPPLPEDQPNEEIESPDIEKQVIAKLKKEKLENEQPRWAKTNIGGTSSASPTTSGSETPNPQPKTPDGRASVPASPEPENGSVLVTCQSSPITSARPETQNPKPETTSGGASVPASHPGSAGLPVVALAKSGVPPASFRNSKPETPFPQLETPNPKPETAPAPPPRKKFYSDPYSRSLRHAHKYDQLSW